MSDLKLDSTHDLAIENFDLVLVSGPDEIAQRLRIKLQMFLGEYYLDTSFGVPYYEEILKKVPNTNTVEAELRGAILETEGVSRLISFDLDLNGSSRELSLSFVAETNSGGNIEVII